MWQLLMDEDETACITCPVRPFKPFGSFLGASQFLECKDSTSTLNCCIVGLTIFLVTNCSILS